MKIVKLVVAMVFVVGVLAATKTAGSATIDFGDWHPDSYADAGQIAGEGLAGPAGEMVFYFNGTWEGNGERNRPDNILTVPTTPNGTYRVDFHEKDDKDFAFTTDENGDIATLTGGGVEIGTISRAGPSALRINTVQIVWNSDADPHKRIAGKNLPPVWRPSGTMFLPIGTWQLHWWGMRDYDQAPAENSIDFDFTITSDGVELTEYVIRGGNPDPAVI